MIRGDLNYDPKLVGQKVNEIMPRLPNFENFINLEEIIKYFKQEIFNCLQQGEMNSALAVIDCFTLTTGIAAKALNLKDHNNTCENESIPDTEYLVWLVGEAESLKIID